MFLSIKNVPKVYWSSKEPLNLKPNLSSLFFLILGLILFGLGEGLLIVSNSGASPWSVLAQGISLNTNLSIGTTTFLVSIFVFVLLAAFKRGGGGMAGLSNLSPDSSSIRIPKKQKLPKSRTCA